MISVAIVNGYRRVRLSEAALNAFARTWPCFGDVRRPLLVEFEPDGSLCDLVGDAGLDEAGVAAIVQDCEAFMAGRSIGRSAYPEWMK